MSVFVIAEAGVNHNGDLGRALKMIDVAAAAGADAVKFQTFRPSDLVSASAPKAPYQVAATGAGESQRWMLEGLRLIEDDHFRLKDRCREQDIDMMSTPFDLASLDFVARRLDLNPIKISSGDATFGPLLLATAETGKDIILSTGMSDLAEVEAALGVIAFGCSKSGGEPSTAAFERAFQSISGQKALEKRLILLHCTTEYPAPFDEVNLRALDTLARAFGLPVGLSDHSDGIAVAIAAAGLGATVIEKHFTLDRALPGPDHQASLEADRLADMVAGIRAVEAAMGSGVKEPTPSEEKNMAVARRSLVALEPIAEGEPFTEYNLGAKRPGGGASPMEYWSRLGSKASRDYAADEQVDP